MTNYNLENKVAVITGAAQGIGLAIAEHFLEKGAKTAVLLDINEDGAKTADKLNTRYGPNKAVYIKCDVTKDLDKVSECIFELYKTVDILVNNAGIKDSSVKKHVDTDAIATMEWTDRFYEHMTEKNNDGTIINISALDAVIPFNQFRPIYIASKFAIYGYCKTLGHLSKFNKTGVRVIVVCPGFTETETENQTIRDNYIIEPHLEEWMKYKNKFIWQKPDVVGKAVAEVYEKADSGTAWTIANNKPAEPVPDYAILPGYM